MSPVDETLSVAAVVAETATVVAETATAVAGTATAVAGTVAAVAGPVAPFVTRAGHEFGGTAQSGGAQRISGVSPQHTPATKLWFGKVKNEPGYGSLPHHHGEAETGGYVLKGHGRIYYGENYAQSIDLHEGDFVFVPPWMPHIEVNVSQTEELIWLTTRTPDNIVINLEDSHSHSHDYRGTGGTHENTSGHSHLTSDDRADG